MSFAGLPIELYEAILFFVPSRDLQYTILSISRTLPFSPVPLQDLFRSVRITRPEQAVHLYRRLRLSNRPTLRSNLDGPEVTEHRAASWIHELFIESWSVDADVVLDLIKLIPRLDLLNLWVGPNNFTPEHLEELFEKPIPGLIHLSLRFRPYVQKANYYQFLKGAYFDSTLVAISRWPPSDITNISIVQDPVPLEQQSKPTFAQPIVFFRLEPSISTLINSESLSLSLTSLRLRVPLRPVARALCLSPLRLSRAPDASSLTMPGLDFIDLSTCALLEQDINVLLVQYKTLKHLVLDGCAVLRDLLREGEWSAMGKCCALTGVLRAKEREKALKDWLETWLAAAAVDNDDVPTAADPNTRVRKVKRGRQGLATATISLRSSSPDAAPSRPTFSKRKIDIPKIRVLPPLPTLATLSMTVSTIKPEVYPTLITEFEAGWAEGIAQLAVTRARLRASASNGVRVVRFMQGSDSTDPADGGFEGLEDIDKDDQAAFDIPAEMSRGRDIYRAPILCLAGDAGEGHIEGCGHSVASGIWVG